jgi:hypothetical protein
MSLTSPCRWPSSTIGCRVHNDLVSRNRNAEASPECIALGALAADDGLRSRMGIAAHEWSRDNFDSRIFGRHLLERRIGQLSAAERRGK